jgi:hypothetical protein
MNARPHAQSGTIGIPESRIGLLYEYRKSERRRPVRMAGGRGVDIALHAPFS